MDMIEKIKAYPRVKYKAGIEAGRHLFQIAISDLENRQEFQSLRAAGSVEDVKMLRESIKTTAGQPVQPPLIYVESDSSGILHYFIADGHQRVKAAKDGNEKHIVVMWIDRWTTIKIAMEESIPMNFARYAVGQDDAMSILASKMLTQAEVARLTGIAPSQISKMAKIAGISWLTDYVTLKIFPVGQAANLIDKTGEDPTKVAALKNTLDTKFAEAKKKADHWANRIKADKTKRWDKRARESARVDSYFKNTPWSEWGDALEDGLLTGNGHDVKLELASGTKIDSAYIGGDEAWEETYAVFNLFGKKHDEVATDDLKTIIDSGPQIIEKLNAIYERRIQIQARMEKPISPSNPVVHVEEPTPPTPQQSNLKIGKKK